jgi:hypothetical protein
MTDPTDIPYVRFRVELDGGESVHADGATVRTASGEVVPSVSMTLPVARAHALAHLLDEWAGAFRLSPGKSTSGADRLLADALEAVAAAVGEPGALRCASRVSGGVTAPQRLAAVGVLAEREERLSAVQRFAVVDAAARWMEEDAGDELAYALLAAACSTDATTSHAYLALLTPPETAGAS